MIEFTMPLPPRLTELFTNKKGKNLVTGNEYVSRVKSAKYKDWLEYCEWWLKRNGFFGRYSINPPEPVTVIYKVHKNWFTKKGDIRVNDVANYEKATSDALPLVFRNFDDSHIFKMTLEKIQDNTPDPFIEIQIFEQNNHETPDSKHEDSSDSSPSVPKEQN